MRLSAPIQSLLLYLPHLLRRLRAASGPCVLACAAAVAWAGAALAADPPCPPEPDLSAPGLAQAATESRDRGFLWRLSRDGRDSYLFGTLHVGRPAWLAPGPRLREALREADVIALELDPLDAETGRGFARAVQRLPAGDGAVSDAQRRRLVRLAERACAALHDQHPLLQIMQLMLLEARRERLDAMFAQEVVLSAAARALKRPVHSLETPEQQLAALLPPGAQQLHDAIERALRQLEEGRVPALMRRLAEVWEQGDLDALHDYPRWCDCQLDDADRAAFARLNDERNPHLAERIAALHGRDGQRVLAAVGALHMTGPQALPLLLAQRHGFRVERVVLTR